MGVIIEQIRMLQMGVDSDPAPTGTREGGGEGCGQLVEILPVGVFCLFPTVGKGVVSVLCPITGVPLSRGVAFFCLK